MIRLRKNERGQGLIEYLIIVALMAVATIAVMRVMGQVVQSRFVTVISALQGDKKSVKVQVDDTLYKKKDMGNFLDGVEGKGENSSQQ